MRGVYFYFFLLVNWCDGNATFSVFYWAPLSYLVTPATPLAPLSLSLRDNREGLGVQALGFQVIILL